MVLKLISVTGCDGVEGQAVTRYYAISYVLMRKRIQIAVQRTVTPCGVTRVSGQHTVSILGAQTQQLGTDTGNPKGFQWCSLAPIG
jgi:hypothetical protein